MLQQQLDPREKLEGTKNLSPAISIRLFHYTLAGVQPSNPSRNAVPEERVVCCAAVLIHQTQALQAALLLRQQQ